MDRAAILALRTRTEPVEVDGLTFHLRGLTARERDAFEASLFAGSGAARSPSLENIRARLLVRALCDPGGVRIFRDDEAEAVGAMPAEIADRLFSAAQRLSGITRADVEDLRGNSSGARSGASSSD